MSGGNAPLPDDEASARWASDRIEQLLGELRTSTSPAAWARIEELVSLVTRVYGRGLERMLGAFGDGRGIDEATRARLCGDPLIEALLLLHGLHPSPADVRAASAIERVRQAIGATAGEILSTFEESGSLVVRLVGDWRRCAVPAAAIETALRRALVETAPEITQVMFERDGAFAEARSEAAPNGLVQIDLARSHRAQPTEAAE